ncbi:MAG: type IV toxin-antitoxin system AbiEi family antitoxin [Gammaproteobacteria bacterium]|nr:type IV toxin-antitoxin system AbiEi family antitoxin [Gammaproteobacteria bacterium]
MVKKQILSNSYQLLNTPTGYMQVSTPEVTGLDLIQYVKGAGHLQHIATVLAELKENLVADRLIEFIVVNKILIPYIQRLGYLLELVEAKSELTQALKQWIEAHKPRVIALRPDKDYQKTEKNSDWRLYINESIEVDDL